MLTPLRPKRTREQLSSSGNATYRPNHGNYLIQVWPLFMNSTSIHPIDVDQGSDQPPLSPPRTSTITVYLRSIADCVRPR
jgi:hypothetical protein